VPLRITMTAAYTAPLPTAVRRCAASFQPAQAGAGTTPLRRALARGDASAEPQPHAGVHFPLSTTPRME